MGGQRAGRLESTIARYATPGKASAKAGTMQMAARDKGLEIS